MKSTIRNEGIYWVVCLLGLAFIAILISSGGDFEYFFKCFETLSLESKASGVVLAILSVAFLVMGHSEERIGMIVLGLLIPTLGGLVFGFGFGVSPRYLITSFALLLVAAAVSVGTILHPIFDRQIRFGEEN